MNDPDKGQGEPDTARGAGRRWRRRVCALALGMALLCVAEGVLRLADYGGPTGMFVRVDDGDGTRSWVTNLGAFRETFSRAAALAGQTSYPAPPPQRFPVEKDPDTYRIVVVGGSAAMGFPHRDCLSFPRFLEAVLNTVCRGRRFEVVSAAVPATGSYTVLERLGGLVRDLDADLVVVYSGHNEFYGAYGQASAIPGARWRSIMLLRMWLGRLRLSAALGDLAAATLPDPGPPERPRHLAQVMPARRDIVLGGDAYRRAHEAYAANLAAVVRRTRRRGAEAVVCTLGSNLRDFPPLGTPDGPAGDMFREAMELEAQGRNEEAADGYRLARDLDTVRWRADSSINHAVRAVAKDEGAVLADAAAHLARNAAGPVPGKGLFLDHVHPTPMGNFLIAECVARAIGGSRVARRLGRWDWGRHRAMDEYAALNGADRLDVIMALQSAVVLQRDVLSDGGRGNSLYAELLTAVAVHQRDMTRIERDVWDEAAEAGVFATRDYYDRLRLLMADAYAAEGRMDDALAELRKGRRYGVWQLDSAALARYRAAEARILGAAAEVP